MLAKINNTRLIPALEHTGNSNVKTSTLTASLTSTLTANLFNEFRFQYSKDREPGLSNSDAPETAVTATAGGISDGAFNFGRNNFSPRETTITRYQFVNNQTYMRIGRAIRFGERFRITLFGEGFNVLNRANVQNVNNTFTFAGGVIARPTNFGTPRQFISSQPSFTTNSSYLREFQLGIRFDF